MRLAVTMIYLRRLSFLIGVFFIFSCESVQKESENLPLKINNKDSTFSLYKMGAFQFDSLNLLTKTFLNGDPIRRAQSAEDWRAAAEGKEPAYCVCGEDSGVVLYNFYALSDPRGIIEKERMLTMEDARKMMNGGSHSYFAKDEPTIEPSFRHHGYRPDLLKLRPHPDPKVMEEEIDLWVECKQVKLSKLDDLVRYCNAPVYWFHTLRHLKRAVLPRSMKKFKRLSKVSMIGITEKTRLLEQHLDQEWVVQTTYEGHIEVFVASELDPISVDFHEFVPENQ